MSTFSCGSSGALLQDVRAATCSYLLLQCRLIHFTRRLLFFTFSPSSCCFMIIVVSWLSGSWMLAATTSFLSLLSRQSLALNRYFARVQAGDRCSMVTTLSESRSAFRLRWRGLTSARKDTWYLGCLNLGQLCIMLVDCWATSFEFWQVDAGGVLVVACLDLVILLLSLLLHGLTEEFFVVEYGTSWSRPALLFFTTRLMDGLGKCFGVQWLSANWLRRELLF